jgi:hypothetical protein
MSEHSKEIDRILKRYFFRDLEKTLDHNYLCTVFEFTSYYVAWKRYWKEINTKKCITLSGYLKQPYSLETSTILRLLVVEDFKKYVDTKRKKK